MFEPIFQPGLHFYILQLRGTLTYSLIVPGKPDRHGEVNDTDLDDIQDQANDEEQTQTEANLNVNTEGLKLQLVKNIGHLVMKFEAKDGARATWIFQGLQELGQGGRLFASSGTQISSATFAIEGMTSNRKPLINAKSETTLCELHAEIVSITARDHEGTIWKVDAGGAAKRQHKRPLDEVIGDDQENEPETTTDGRRSQRL
ncbi:hypothetical protein EK21DRAFT_87358 [Setomelanomma holmii]|uniref:Uncharacterized protein n=1 Tax=Setomelanomma holmii TaxID=210430 RepID=A0A9P4HCX5_9PLEO|nr:hypothetical protein EK21DRAFT_87358 [Setomelanomma holmii]